MTEASPRQGGSPREEKIGNSAHGEDPSSSGLAGMRPPEQESTTDPQESNVAEETTELAAEEEPATVPGYDDHKEEPATNKEEESPPPAAEPAPEPVEVAAAPAPAPTAFCVKIVFAGEIVERRMSFLESLKSSDADLRVREKKTLTFTASDLGITFFPGTTPLEVKDVQAGSQAQEFGVRKGWQVLQVGAPRPQGPLSEGARARAIAAASAAAVEVEALNIGASAARACANAGRGDDAAATRATGQRPDKGRGDCGLSPEGRCHDPGYARPRDGDAGLR